MATAALELLADPGRRRAMGEAARLRVIEQFTLRQTIDTFRSVYLELAHPKQELTAMPATAMPTTVRMSAPAVDGTGSLAL
jgi:hypothetical protein